MKNFKTNHTNKWLNFSIYLNGQVLTNSVISDCLKTFWIEVVSSILNHQYILLQFKVEGDKGDIKSISYVQTVNKDDLNTISNVFNEFWNIKGDEYHSMEVSKIIFTYKVLPLELDISKSKILNHQKSIKSNKLSTFKFGGHDLPCTMDFTEWGETHFYKEYTKAIVYKHNSKGEYHINIFDNHILVDLKIDDKIILSFKDTLSLENSYDLYSFKREFKNQTFLIKNGKLKLKTLKRNTKFLTKIKPSISLSYKFMTMDIETRNINGILSAYLVSIYDGQNLTNFYLSDFKDENEFLENAVLSIMKRKYDGYRVYLHNFSNFDGIFLMKILNKLSDNIIPLINDNKFIEIKFKYGKYSLKFRDSLLLLPSSLDKLATEFKVENKGTFPILIWNNPDIDLNYIGEVPPIDSFVNLDKDKYNEYCKYFEGKKWNLKLEAIKYCNQDVVTLYQIIDKFANIIFDEIRLDISKYPTISSLSLAIFRCRFLKDNYNIPIITGQMYNDISLSYTGGNVDVFKPYGENIFHYDVNSLYPYIMKEFPMPSGTPVYFEGDITKYDKDAFGFFEAKIEAPKDLYVPLLQKRLKYNNSYKTVSPVGTWKGFYLSEELIKAKELNYKIEVIRGYVFKKEYIFKDFVDYFYNLKVNNPKNSAYYAIAKLILNGLYGRFGMSPYKENHIIINNSDSYKIYNNFTVTNVINFDNKELISYLDFEDYEKESNFNISIPIASAVTSLARLFMYKFKTMKSNIYYTDTDSVALDSKLDDYFIGSELGKFKLEYISKKAIFLAPKVYYCKTNLGDICKIKGLKIHKNDIGKTIKFEDFYALLFKDNKILLQQEKWNKNLEAGNITINKDNYTLKTTLGKRELIYDNSNKFVNTKPLHLINGEIE